MTHVKRVYVTKGQKPIARQLRRDPDGVVHLAHAVGGLGGDWLTRCYPLTKGLGLENEYRLAYPMEGSDVEENTAITCLGCLVLDDGT